MRLGILGGSFDPIHHAHLILAQTALEQLALDRVHLVVAGDQPFKQGRHHATARQRLDMVERAVARLPGCVADATEVERPGPSFTVDTLTAFRARFPAAELVLLLGADAAAGFARWREPEQIRALARIAVCGRDEADPPAGFDAIWTPPAMAISSTMVRTRQAAGQPLIGWVPEGVADYIAGLRLYGSSGG